MISRDTLVSFFADTRRLRQDGKAGFDVDDTLSLVVLSSLIRHGRSSNL